MIVAEKRFVDYGVSVRRDGKFAGNTPHEIVAVLFQEAGWETILVLAESRCRNMASTAIIDDRLDLAQIWLSRSAALKKLAETTS